MPPWDLAACWAQHAPLRTGVRGPGISLGSAVCLTSGPQNPSLHAPQARKKRNTEAFHPGEVQSCLMPLDHWHGHPTAYGRAPAPRAPRATHRSQEVILCLLDASRSSYRPRHTGTCVGVCEAAEVWGLRPPPSSPLRSVPPCPLGTVPKAHSGLVCPTSLTATISCSSSSPVSSACAVLPLPRTPWGSGL